jgi:hypothetical protein
MSLHALRREMTIPRSPARRPLKFLKEFLKSSLVSTSDGCETCAMDETERPCRHHVATKSAWEGETRNSPRGFDFAMKKCRLRKKVEPALF